MQAIIIYQYISPNILNKAIVYLDQDFHFMAGYVRFCRIRSFEFRQFLKHLIKTDVNPYPGGAILVFNTNHFQCKDHVSGSQKHVRRGVFHYKDRYLLLRSVEKSYF